MIVRQLFVAVLLIFSAVSPASAQTCQSETAVPSTTPTIRFQNNGDDTVTDKATGLMWARCPEGLFGTDCTTGSAATFTWQEALTRAREVTLAGYGDWRVPNIKELSTLVEERCSDPAINLTVFPNTPASYFWSASPFGYNTASGYISDYAWVVVFNNGSANNGYRSNSYPVRLVRSEQ